MTKTAVEIIVLHEDDVDPRAIAEKLYFTAKRSAAQTTAFNVDSYRLGESVSGPVPAVFQIPMPRRECSGPLPGRDVTVVQTGSKTHFIQERWLD